MNRLKRPPMSLLRKMEKLLPYREGAISLKLFTDGSWIVEIEYQAIIIASMSQDNPKIYLQERLIKQANPEWLPEIREWFSKIKEIWTTFI